MQPYDQPDNEDEPGGSIWAYVLAAIASVVISLGAVAASVMEW